MCCSAQDPCSGEQEDPGSAEFGRWRHGGSCTAEKSHDSWGGVLFSVVAGGSLIDVGGEKVLVGVVFG